MTSLKHLGSNTLLKCLLFCSHVHLSPLVISILHLFFAFILPNRVYALQFKINFCMVYKLSFEQFSGRQDFMSISVRKISDI